MKTSFYFVLWILIYPILGLLNNQFINNNAFIAALVIVFGLSWLLNRLIPGILAYERACESAPILEDIYLGNIESFKDRLKKKMAVEIITAVYFIVTTVVISIAVFKLGIADYLALAIFAFFSLSAIGRSSKLIKAYNALKEEPTQEQCIVTANDVYGMDYTVYYNVRVNYSYEDMLTPSPRYFKVFQWFSIIMASLATLLGIFYLVIGCILLITADVMELRGVAVMYLLYGTLATYFGITDFISLIDNMRATKHRK